MTSSTRHHLLSHDVTQDLQKDHAQYIYEQNIVKVKLLGLVGNDARKYLLAQLYKSLDISKTSESLSSWELHQLKYMEWKVVDAYIYGNTPVHISRDF